MTVAIIADVHANFPALEAVLAAVERTGAERVVSLGDLVGYNADPAPCLDALRRRVNVFVAGNHDLDIAHRKPSPGTHPVARDVQAWTRDQLSEDEISFLSAQPRIVADPEGFVAVHGCYLNTLFYTGYVTGTMLLKNLQAVSQAADWPRVALCGHTHKPMLAWLRGGVVEERSTEVANEWPEDADAVLINPGAVGQPRDGDPRAAFALVDFQRRTVSIEKVPYDIERACRSIEDAGLPLELADRLREGR